RLASSGRYLVGLGPFRDPVSSPLSVVFAPCELGPLSLLSGPSGILSVVRCRSSSCLASSGRSRWSWASSGRSRWSRALPGFRSRLSVVSGFPGPPPLSTAARGAAPHPGQGGGAPTTPQTASPGVAGAVTGPAAYRRARRSPLPGSGGRGQHATRGGGRAQERTRDEDRAVGNPRELRLGLCFRGGERAVGEAPRVLPRDVTRRVRVVGGLVHPRTSHLEQVAQVAAHQVPPEEV